MTELKEQITMANFDAMAPQPIPQTHEDHTRVITDRYAEMTGGGCPPEVAQSLQALALTGEFSIGQLQALLDCGQQAALAGQSHRPPSVNFLSTLNQAGQSEIGINSFLHRQQNLIEIDVES
ncbi:hypothetical protein A2160_01475 [Candidatus Beckwithbacteria bacterium RBG_13_42_9]|uniref:Uncharacterized protein n=1 Tax=Candidatus Beckwithbacteria bacterium RBG_13_42_9 TaxID=1797457 RepID=A0A1F5E941_9BACT|nr:MAG: hypothetical protein A2160_01475 [Candidatus Beckwithbacteria bacterium RBG_13_42_9]